MKTSYKLGSLCIAQHNYCSTAVIYCGPELCSVWTQVHWAVRHCSSNAASSCQYQFTITSICHPEIGLRIFKFLQFSSGYVALRRATGVPFAEIHNCRKMWSGVRLNEVWVGCWRPPTWDNTTVFEGGGGRWRGWKRLLLRFEASTLSQDAARGQVCVIWKSVAYLRKWKGNC